MEVKTVTEQLLFSTVRIETDKGVGTGFLMKARLNFGGSMIFLITNKHVIEGAKNILSFFTKAEVKENSESKKEKSIIQKIKATLGKSKSESKVKENFPVIGEKQQCDLGDQEWFNHPNKEIDLTLINISPILNDLAKENITVFIRTVPLELIPLPEELKEFDALENILFIGYPNGLYDSKNLLPIIRRGITATPIYTSYEGKPVFLIDASVFPGSSGSPVFVYDKGSFKTRDGTTHMGDRIYFCGVLSEGYFMNDEGKIEFREIPTRFEPVIKKSEMIDLGVVIHSDKVKELLNLYLEHLNKKNREKNEQR